MLRQALKCFWFFPSSLLANFWQYFHCGSIKDKTTCQAEGRAGGLCGRNPRGALSWEAESSPLPTPLGMGITCSTRLNKGLYYLCTMSLSNNTAIFLFLTWFILYTLVIIAGGVKGPLCIGFIILQKESILCDRSSELGLSISLLYCSSWPLLLWVLNVSISLHRKRGRQQYTGITYRCVTRIN